MNEGGERAEERMNMKKKRQEEEAIQGEQEVSLVYEPERARTFPLC